MVKRVLDIGNCGPDHGSIMRMLKKHFEVDVVQADAASDAIAKLHEKKADLVLVNRKLDIDYTDGLDVIRAIKSIPELTEIPVMLITNHDNYQLEAISIGAVFGFGKLQMSDPTTYQRLAPFLA